MEKKNVSSSKFVLPLTYFVVIWDAFKKLVYISPPSPLWQTGGNLSKVSSVQHIFVETPRAGGGPI